MAAQTKAVQRGSRWRKPRLSSTVFRCRMALAMSYRQRMMPGCLIRTSIPSRHRCARAGIAPIRWNAVRGHGCCLHAAESGPGALSACERLQRLGAGAGFGRRINAPSRHALQSPHGGRGAIGTRCPGARGVGAVSARQTGVSKARVEARWKLVCPNAFKRRLELD